MQEVGDIGSEARDEVVKEDGWEGRACWGGGYVLAPAIQVNTIEYFQMNSTGNARDFGDLTVTRSILSSLSDSHGGLGGI